MIQEDALNLLACPLSHDPLRLEGDRLVNIKWGIRYPIRDGIPVLLIDQAELPDGVGSLQEMKQKILTPPKTSVISENPS